MYKYIHIVRYKLTQVYSCHNVSVDLGQGQEILVLNSWVVLEIH